MKSICLVGHGTSLLDGGKGKFIDGHDDVLRFLVMPGRAKVPIIPEDYGTRIDIWMASAISVRYALKEPRSCRELWIFNKYAAGKNRHRDDEKVRRRLPTYPCEIKKDDDSIAYWLGVYKKLRQPKKVKVSHFTRGTAALIMAAASGEYDPITLAGFDAVTGDNGDWYSSILWDDLGIPMTSRQEDYRAEHQMLGMIQKKYGATIQW